MGLQIWEHRSPSLDVESFGSDLSPNGIRRSLGPYAFWSSSGVGLRPITCSRLCGLGLHG
jgi:hypothetical protein